MTRKARFLFDVFLSHSSKDKDIVRPIAERLRSDGVRVWFDEWRIKPGDNILRSVEQGLEFSRALILFISENVSGSSWVTLESNTFRFRDPINQERRFIPLRLKNANIPSGLAQFLYINWTAESAEQAYEKLLQSCRPQTVSQIRFTETNKPINKKSILSFSFNHDCTKALTGAGSGIVRLIDPSGLRRTRRLLSHKSPVWAAQFYDEQHCITGSDDHTIRYWDLANHTCLRTFQGHTGHVTSLDASADGRYIASGASDCTVRIWNLETAECLQIFRAGRGQVYGIAFSPDGNYILSGLRDFTIRLWEIKSGECRRVFRGHVGELRTLIWSGDQETFISGAGDSSIRLWSVKTGQCLGVFEGHTSYIWSLALSIDEKYLLSGATDGGVKLWDVASGTCLDNFAIPGDENEKIVRCVAWMPNQSCALIGDGKGKVWSWDVSTVLRRNTDRLPNTAKIDASPPDERVLYTNAKVLLIGESGSGKTGLSKILAGEMWEPSDSTVGAWATHWKLPVAVSDGVEREVWVWDFGGQADQRLIHQLYFDETAAAVLVFDGQKEDTFETLGQWDRDITRASRRKFSKLLVAGRVDAGGLRVSRAQIETFARERGYFPLIETSAKTGQGCEKLKSAIIESISWEEIPWRSSPTLFKTMKEEILHLKDEGKVLLRFNELREMLRFRMPVSVEIFTDSQLRAVIALLSGPGVVLELEFGSWILLQPERINSYAQAAIQTMRQDERERGCIAEERVLTGDLTYSPSATRLDKDEERFVLLAMHQILVQRGLCIREHTENGIILVFPSYYRRERPDLVGHPAVLVAYRFTGFLDDIYATLVVRLHHNKAFKQDQLWRYAADFKTIATSRTLGIKMTRRGEGAGELEVYFDPAIPLGEKIIFSKYIHEYLLQNANDVERLRYYVCPYCGTPVENKEVAMRRLKEGKADILCVNCDDTEKRVPLWDDMEELFADPEVKKKVYDLQQKSDVILDNESKERALVGEVVSTVALAGQIAREFLVSDHGIDMEVEFKSDSGEATGRKVYLQLKSGDSYLTIRKSDGIEVFNIAKIRHISYWKNQAFPVLLLIRISSGEIRWMDIRNYLRKITGGEKKSVRQIEFSGERFDVMSVRRWRDIWMN